MMTRWLLLTLHAEVSAGRCTVEFSNCRSGCCSGGFPLLKSVLMKWPLFRPFTGSAKGRWRGIGHEVMSEAARHLTVRNADTGITKPICPWMG
jgi:hypothetical protein